MTRDLLVASRKIFDVSVNSTMNLAVERIAQDVQKMCPSIGSGLTLIALCSIRQKHPFACEHGRASQLHADG